MGIKQSVGRSGVNSNADVKLVQAALNLSHSKKFTYKKLKIDGKIGNVTIKAIEAYQTNVLGMTNPDGRADAGGKTIKSLKNTLTKGLSEDSLFAIMAKGQAATIKTYLPLMKSVFDELKRAPMM